MWVMPGIECWARGSKGGSGQFPDTRAHPGPGTRGWHGDTCQCVSTTQSAQTCQMRSNYERILRTLDWAYQSWLMSSCQGRVRVISSKAQSSADVYIFSVARPITKSHDGDYDCEVDPGTRALTPGSQCSHYADHRHPVCVWTCVQCVIISAHITASASPLPFIHCGQSGAWANKHPALFMPGLKPHPSHLEHSRPAWYPSRFTQIF